MIERRVLPSGRVSWRVRWRDSEGKERSRSFPTRKEARTFDAERVGRGGRFGARVTVAELWDEFQASRVHLKPRTLQGYRTVYRTHLTVWASRDASSITRAQVQDFVNSVAAQRSPATVRHVRFLLRALLQQGVDDGRFARNPVAGVRIPRMVAAERRTLAPSDLVPLWESMPTERTRAVVMVLACTGLRWGEVAGLRWGDLDVEGQVLHVQRAYAEVHGKPVLGATKSHRPRVIPVPERLVEALVCYRASTGGRPDELIFRTRTGTSITNANFRREAQWSKTVAAQGHPGLRIHDLRHTYASIQLAAGLPVPVVQQLLGHSNAAVTMSIYAHAVPGGTTGALLAQSFLPTDVATDVATNEESSD